MRTLLPLLLIGCSSGDPKETASPELPHRLLVVGWDGVRADAVEQAHTPNLDRVAAWGGLSHGATSQLSGPTASAAGWTSIHTGQEPGVHGVTDNGVYDDRDGTWKTFLEQAHDADLRTMAAVVWGEVAYQVIGNDFLDEAHWGDEDSVGAWLIERIEGDRVDAGFVHQDAPDHAGHATGFTPDNPEYMAAIEASDVRLGKLLDALENRSDAEWLVIVTTDHGGLGTDHGPIEPIYQQIFLATGVVGGSGGTDMTGASHLDVAPTALDWLGLDADARGLPGTVRTP